MSVGAVKDEKHVYKNNTEAMILLQENKKKARAREEMSR
jgi:hypothetical protein